MNRRVLGFMTLYYGKPFLRESLLSIVDHVDKMVISYTAKPSHGFSTSEPCPDTEEELREICQSVLGGKMRWISAPDGYQSEGYHRDTRYNYANGYDCILTIDADEIMVGIPEAIEYAMTRPAQYYGIQAYGYVNFWRSFNWHNRDAFAPIRLENLHNMNGVQDHGCPLTVYHFSTALPEKYMRFKYLVMGHASEIKPNYLEDIFYKWTPETVNEVTHLHPTSNDIWHVAQPFDKTLLPDYLKKHYLFNETLIK